MRLVHNSLHDEVADGLRARIFEGLLAPGSFIDEAALCTELAISRTPLREALKVLAAEGLVRHEPRRGCFVNQITERDLDEIFPVIALLEGRCAFEAASNATDADLVKLEQMHERLSRFARNRRINDYYQANFSPYQFRQARILEFPDYARFAQAFANTMPYSEGIGFIADNTKPDKIDFVTYVTAHELAHQWWAHQVIGADMQGGTSLSETLAQYSALIVMEKTYGPDGIRKFLKQELDGYLRSRGGEL
eukprot:gene20640-40477_t